MPKIRYTYGRDVARYGADPVDVHDITARKLVADRRAELVDELHIDRADDTCADCPVGGCAGCDVLVDGPA